MGVAVNLLGPNGPITHFDAIMKRKRGDEALIRLTVPPKRIGKMAVERVRHIAPCLVGVQVAIDETVILLHPPLPLVGVSIVMERECQQNDSLVKWLGARCDRAGDSRGDAGARDLAAGREVDADREFLAAGHRSSQWHHSQSHLQWRAGGVAAAIG